MLTFIKIYLLIGLVITLLPIVFSLWIDKRFFDESINTSDEKLAEIIYSILVIFFWPWEIICGIKFTIKKFKGEPLSEEQERFWEIGARQGREARKRVKKIFKGGK